MKYVSYVLLFVVVFASILLFKYYNTEDIILTRYSPQDEDYFIITINVSSGCRYCNDKELANTFKDEIKKLRENHLSNIKLHANSIDANINNGYRIIRKYGYFHSINIGNLHSIVPSTEYINFSGSQVEIPNILVEKYSIVTDTKSLIYYVSGANMIKNYLKSEGLHRTLLENQ